MKSTEYFLITSYSYFLCVGEQDFTWRQKIVDLGVKRANPFHNFEQGKSVDELDMTPAYKMVTLVVCFDFAHLFP